MIPLGLFMAICFVCAAHYKQVACLSNLVILTAIFYAFPQARLGFLFLICVVTLFMIKNKLQSMLSKSRKSSK